MTAFSNNIPVLSSESDLAVYMRKIAKFPLLTLEQEQDLAKRLEQGDIKAAEVLVTSHLRLVVKIATSFKNYGLPMMDIISEGNIGLMKAVKKFDVSKGYRLSTYAMLWIKAQIQEYILRSWSLVKLGTTTAQKKIFFNLAKIKKRLLKYDQEYLSSQNVEQIAGDLGVSKTELINMESRLNQGDVFIFDKMSQNEDEEGSSLAERLADDAPNQEEIYSEAQIKEQRSMTLHQAIATLNEREKHIISVRKLTDEPQTLDELSKYYNISKERVRQIEARALEKIKAFFATDNV